LREKDFELFFLNTQRAKVIRFELSAPTILQLNTVTNLPKYNTKIKCVQEKGSELLPPSR
jgi:hypothetical protein